MAYSIQPANHATVSARGVYTCLGLDTSPAYFDGDPQRRYLFAIWKLTLKVQVVDQNGNPATGAAGSSVMEALPDSSYSFWQSINQRVSSNGKYDDPVGYMKQVNTLSAESTMSCADKLSKMQSYPAPVVLAGFATTLNQTFIVGIGAANAGPIGNRKVVIKNTSGETSNSVKIFVCWPSVP